METNTTKNTSTTGTQLTSKGKVKLKIVCKIINEQNDKIKKKIISSKTQE